MARRTVATATDRQLRPCLAGADDEARDVVGIADANNQRGAAVDVRGEDGARVVVTGILRGQDSARDAFDHVVRGERHLEPEHRHAPQPRLCERRNRARGAWRVPQWTSPLRRRRLPVYALAVMRGTASPGIEHTL